MKHPLITSLFGLIILSNFAFAQPVPETPAWTFPLYFEDALGQKDTLYFGYDTRANNPNIAFDTIFGEKCQLADTSKLWATFDNCGSFEQNKISIVSDTLPNGALYSLINT